VLDDVGERFLDDPVGGEVDPGGQRSAPSAHLQVDPYARVLRTGDETVEVGEAGRRAELGGQPRSPVVAQQPEQPARLPQRVAAGLLDRRQHARRLIGPGGEDVVGHPRLDGDEAHAVRDDVVQLTGDAQPFLRHLRPRPFLGAPFRLLVHRRRVRALLADGVSDRPRGGDEAAHEEHSGVVRRAGDRGLPEVDGDGVRRQHGEEDR
jgi:hypothetical protein